MSAAKKTSAPASKTAAKTAAKIPPKAKVAAKPAGASKSTGDTGTASYGPKIGSKAPAFKLSDETGNRVSPADFKGRKLILYFYPKDSTPGCTTESCDFRDSVNRFAKSGAAVLGISADSVASHVKFKAKYGLNFPLISDPDHEALEAYGVWQEKSLYGRKFMGIMRTTVIIDEEGKVARVFPKVKVAGHVEEVLASLK
jgi:thioredoxin-dependent peroxiredoxin